MMEIELGVNAFINTPYRHPRVYKDDIECVIKELLALDHIRSSSSPFASSVVLMKKKDGTLCKCIDYRALNKKNLKNRYPILHIDEFMDELRGAKYFFKIYLCSMYHQIKVMDQDIPKTAFSRTWEEHLHHLEVVLCIFEEQHFYTNLFKCEFGLT
eukprot:PITA_26089